MGGGPPGAASTELPSAADGTPADPARHCLHRAQSIWPASATLEIIAAQVGKLRQARVTESGSMFVTGCQTAALRLARVSCAPLKPLLSRPSHVAPAALRTRPRRGRVVSQATSAPAAPPAPAGVGDAAAVLGTAELHRLRPYACFARLAYLDDEAQVCKDATCGLLASTPLCATHTPPARSSHSLAPATVAEHPAPLTRTPASPQHRKGLEKF